MPTVDDFLEEPPDWDTLFPAHIDLPADGTFELGITMGGTISAGAYTAGVVDFLIEALDRWEEARKGAEVPNWRTRIKVLTGTSGGGVTAAIMARTLSFAFPPIRRTSPGTDRALNPLYTVWVDMLDIDTMLDTTDIDQSTNLRSLLNPQALENAANYIARLGQTHGQQKLRSYVDDPLPVFLTLTNMRGVPYCIDMGNGAESYIDHGDYIRLGVRTNNGNVTPRPDELCVSDVPTSGAGYIGWADATQFALGTSAFPVGFPLRALNRPIEHYRYRPLVAPGDDKVRQAIPVWKTFLPSGSTQLPAKYPFLVADGGMTDNEPIELCRKTLAGQLGTNPRDGLQAKRAVLLIDPFAEPPQLGPEGWPGIVKAIQGLGGTWKDQARYSTRDVVLAADQDCFSRFLITARRQGAPIGSKSIATASVGAFGGFLSTEYRRHDFLLGRANCQAYLRSELVLPEKNPLFSAWKKAYPAEVTKWRVKDVLGRDCLPVIPLFGECRADEDTEPYPTDVFDPRKNAFRVLLEDRINAVFDKAQGELLPGGFFQRLYESIGMNVAKRTALDKAIDVITASLKDWKLLN